MGLYKHAVEVIAETGIGHYDSFMKQVTQYKGLLKGIMLDKYPLDPNKVYWGSDELMKVMSKVEFKLSDIPEFREKPTVVRDAVKSAVWDIFFIFLFSFLFFMGSVVAFLRYDVR